MPAAPTPRLRPVTHDDRVFLVALYAETRTAELELVDWDAATKAAFIEQQFSAQDAHYRSNYPGATLDLVEVGSQRAGRLYVHRSERDIRIVDILLAAPFRGRGVGGGLLSELIDVAAASGRTLSVHVEMGNRARSLYERLAFRPVAEHGLYVLMERPPGPAQVKTAS